MRGPTAFFLSLLTLCFLSCSTHQPSEKSDEYAKASSSEPYFPTDTLQGTYVGKLDDAPISLVIHYTGEGRLTGYNVVSGNRRNINGKFMVSTEGLNFTASEPGDDKNDGVFNLTMYKNDLSVISGEWTSAAGRVKKVWVKRAKSDESGLGEEFYMWSTPVFSDTVLTVTFDNAGTCNYSYYRNSGMTNEQYVKVEGTYERSGKTVVAQWLKADLLPKKSVFQLITTDEVAYENEDGPIYVHKLVGHNRELSEEIMP